VWVRGAASEFSGDDALSAGGWRLAGVMSSSGKQNFAATELYTIAGDLARQRKTAL
jgi:hypothetical protein